MCLRMVHLSAFLLHSCTLLKQLNGMRCHLAPSLIVLDGSRGSPMGRGDFGVWTSSRHDQSAAAIRKCLLVFTRCQHYTVLQQCCLSPNYFHSFLCCYGHIWFYFMRFCCCQILFVYVSFYDLIYAVKYSGVLCYIVK